MNLGGGVNGVSYTASLLGLPRDVGGIGYQGSGSGGFYLTSNHVGFTALDVDCPRIPEVDDGKSGADLLVATGTSDIGRSTWQH